MSILRVLLAIFLPPISVLMTDGFGLHLILNIILCLFGWLPGSIHAVWRLVQER